MLRSTFQLGPGLGPAREKALWAREIACWEEYLASPAARGSAVAGADALRAAIEEAVAAVAAGDLERLTALIPSGEHWRLFGELGPGAAYLDIETSDDVVGYAGISAIGVLDRSGSRLFLAERDLHLFPEASRDWSMLVTFNGLSFDVPVLERAFPGWRPPAVHVDVRHVLGRLGHRGTLKQLEERLGLHLARPEHLRVLNASGASALYRRGRDGDREALRRFVEYNLYDAIGLRTLMAFAYNGRLEALASRSPALRAAARPVEVPGRGDVVYDVSKLLLAL